MIAQGLALTMRWLCSGACLPVPVPVVRYSGIRHTLDGIPMIGPYSSATVAPGSSRMPMPGSYFFSFLSARLFLLPGLHPVRPAGFTATVRNLHQNCTRQTVRERGQTNHTTAERFIIRRNGAPHTWATGRRASQVLLEIWWGRGGMSHVPEHATCYACRSRHHGRWATVILCGAVPQLVQSPSHPQFALQESPLPVWIALADRYKGRGQTPMSAASPRACRLKPRGQWWSGAARQQGEQLQDGIE